MSNALDRLNDLATNVNKDADISIDDYIEDNTNDIINRMNNFTEVTLDDNVPAVDPIVDPVAEPIATDVTKSKEVKEIPIDVTDTGEDIMLNEELFNNNSPQTEEKGKRRRRKKKDTTVEVDPTPAMDSNVTKIDSNPLYNQLAKNLIEDLKKRKYTFNGFNVESMQILYDYIQAKF